jgi:hypothetical protein
VTPFTQISCSRKRSQHDRKYEEKGKIFRERLLQINGWATALRNWETIKIWIVYFFVPSVVKGKALWEDDYGRICHAEMF